MSAMKVQNKRNEQRITSLARRVRQLGKADEVKFHDFASPITTSNAGTITLLSGIAEGAGSAERNGVSIAPIRVTLRDGVIFALTTWYRLILFQDNFTAGVLPVVADVLAAAAWNGSYNHLNETNKRIRILADYTLNGVPAVDSAIQNVVTRKAISGTMKFIGATNAQASAGAGALYVLRITGAGATQPTSDLRLELQYRG